VACHFQGGMGGAGLNQQNVVAFDVVPTRTNPKFHSGVVHAAADVELNHECTAEVNRLFPIVQGEQRNIGGCVVSVPDFDPVRFTPINAPALFGAGDIARISDGAIRGNLRQRQLAAYPRELRGDFSSTSAGRTRILPDGRIGKFGWKAQFATLDEFVASACAIELGLSNPRRKQDRPHQQGEDREAQLDMSSEQVFTLTSFTGSLPRPAQVLPSDAAQRSEVQRGERLFASIGCADCHTANLGAVAGIYSDLLLHKLEDDRDLNKYARVDPEIPLPDGQPFPNEWKTPPLWGVADTAPYFHDGRSLTLESAILRHGLQAKHVTARFTALELEDQRAVIGFLGTLRAPRAEPVPPRATEQLAARQTEPR